MIGETKPGRKLGGGYPLNILYHNERGVSSGKANFKACFRVIEAAADRGGAGAWNSGRGELLAWVAAQIADRKRGEDNGNIPGRICSRQHERAGADRIRGAAS